MTIDDIASAYETSTNEFLTAVRSISDEQLDRHVKDGWSPRQVVHHMADSEAQSYARLRRLVAEAPGTTIQGYDEALWAENDKLGYRELPIEHSLAVVVAVRTSSLDILRRLSIDDLSRTGTHSESGSYLIQSWTEIYTAHARDHAAQLLEAANAN